MKTRFEFKGYGRTGPGEEKPEGRMVLWVDIADDGQTTLTINSLKRNITFWPLVKLTLDAETGGRFCFTLSEKNQGKTPVRRKENET